MGYLSEDAKQAIVQKALGQRGRGLKALAEAHHIGYSTLQKWVSCYRKEAQPGGLSQKGGLSAADKLKHLLATAALDEEGLGAYCRGQGIYSFELQQWKEDLMREKSTEKRPSEGSELKRLRAENKALKQELQRKDRALAETSALLVLKKKAALVWGEVGDV